MSAVPTIDTKATVVAERQTERQIAANRTRPAGS
jgi:membrane fusion protein (multidrug efflux system)